MKKDKEKQSNKEPELNAEVEGLKSKIAGLEKQLEEEKESKLLVLADFLNFKKRLENEKNDYRIFATKMIITQLMQVTDDYSRLKKDMEEKLKDKAELKDVINGIQMLNDKVSFIITQNGFEEIQIKDGDKFNPETMEALTTAPVKDKKEDGTVMLVDQKGYKHIESGLVFRTAKVIIGKFNS